MTDGIQKEWDTKMRMDGSYRLGQLAGLLGGVDNLVVEDREVKSEAEADGMCRLHLFLADVRGIAVGLFGTFNDL